MTVSRPDKGPLRRERQPGNVRANRVNLSFNDTELSVVSAAATGTANWHSKHGPHDS